MTPKKDKGTGFIVVSIIALVPNLGCLIFALTDMYPPPIILLIVPGIMILAAALGIYYGISLRKRSE